MPERPFHEDWIIFLILIAAFFYASLPLYSRKLFPGATRFFLFRGVGDPEARETSELFHWQSTIFNLITFFNLALFIYCTASYYALIPEIFPDLLSGLIALGIVIVAVTLRHIVCMITGWLSGQKEVLDEYIITIYQSYRYHGICLLRSGYSPFIYQYCASKNAVSYRLFLICYPLPHAHCTPLFNFSQEECFYFIFDFVPLCAGNSACSRHN